MKVSSGFTLVELLVIFVLAGVIGGIAYGQHQSLASIHRDQDRKIAINAIYYNLQEVAKPKLGGYPRVLKATDLTAMDASLLKDPKGRPVGKATSDYRYEATGCNGGDICSGFRLRTALERETDFVRTNNS